MTDAKFLHRAEGDDFDAEGQKIINMAVPVEETDGASKACVSADIATHAAIAGAHHDCEEGNWTAQVADASSGGNETTSTTGKYKKSGNLVVLTARLNDIDTTGLTAGNSLYITGLPFINGSIAAIGSVNVDRINFSADAYLNAYIQGAGLWMIVRESTKNASDTSVIISELTDGVTDISFTIVYMV